MSTKVVTGKVRFSYANVWEPASMEEGQDKKYSVSLIIPKDDEETVEMIESAIKSALEAGKVKFGGKIPKNFKNPLRDGDEERPDDENYENSYFVNAKSSEQPGIVDKNVKPILERKEFYSGCFGRASITFYAYNYSGSKGVAVGLNNLQKLEEGPNLGVGFSTPEDDFGSEEDELM